MKAVNEKKLNYYDLQASQLLSANGIMPAILKWWLSTPLRQKLTQIKKANQTQVKKANQEAEAKSK